MDAPHIMILHIKIIYQSYDTTTIKFLDVVKLYFNTFAPL